ncbi:MAG: c-type cytochrome domain-containing protein, partial [Planctomycetia bacterium]
MNIRLTLVMLLLLVGTFAIARADEVFSKVEALLKARCYECHSHEKKIKGGLALDSKSGWEKGGESGPAIIPGKPEASLFIKALGHAEVDLKMPPKGMLPSAEIEVFKEWIRLGAKDPRVIKSPEKSKELATQDAWDAEFKKRLDWWSLKPMVTVLPPMVQNAEWSGEPIDRFIRSALD